MLQIFTSEVSCSINLVEEIFTSWSYPFFIPSDDLQASRLLLFGESSFLAPNLPLKYIVSAVMKSDCKWSFIYFLPNVNIITRFTTTRRESNSGSFGYERKHPVCRNTEGKLEDVSGSALLPIASLTVLFISFFFHLSLLSSSICFLLSSILNYP